MHQVSTNTTQNPESLDSLWPRAYVLETSVLSGFKSPYGGQYIDSVDVAFKSSILPITQQ